MSLRRRHEAAALLLNQSAAKCGPEAAPAPPLFIPAAGNHHVSAESAFCTQTADLTQTTHVPPSANAPPKPKPTEVKMFSSDLLQTFSEEIRPVSVDI